jgi:RNA polymerase sigma-B factor
LARARKHNDSRARDQLFVEMMPLARRLARQFQAPGEPLDDLLQVAGVALLGALERFDPDRRVGFHAFAIPSITGELKRYRRDCCWSVRVPRALKERSLLVNRELSRLSGELGRHPTPAELASRCALSQEELLEASRAGDCYRAVSLDDEGTAVHQLATAGEDPALRNVEDREALDRAMGDLSKRERRVLALRFADDLSQAEIARRVGLSRKAVSRLLARTLDQVGIALAPSG